MLKKITLLLMLVLPMGVFAQTLKFGHMNSTEVIMAMPDYTKAMDELKALQEQYTKDLTQSNEEFSKKYQEFLKLNKDSIPQNIWERRQKDLEDMSAKLQQFQQEAQQSMEKAENDKMMPIYQKLDAAIKAVGAAEGVVYIFDIARTPIPYVGAQSTDLTAKIKTQLGIK